MDIASFGILSGLIFMCVLGPAVGNYACSIVYRLPRGQTPFEKKPYCGHCNAMLQPIDLFPLLSFILTRGKCRYCKGSIPFIYFFIELACLVLFVVNFLLLGMSQEFILLTALGVFLIIIVAIDVSSGFISSYMMTLALSTAALYRTSLEPTIYPWFQSGFAWLFFAAMMWQISRKGKGVLAEVPQFVWLSTLFGVCLPPPYSFVAALAALTVWILQRITCPYRSPSAAICVSVLGFMIAKASGVDLF